MEIIWVMRVSIIIVGILATVMALTIPSIYGLWYVMCSKSRENICSYMYTSSSPSIYI
jgi:hypothetical protein